MRIFRMSAAACLVVLSTGVAGVMTSGIANAATSQTVAGCSANGTVTAYGNVSCTAADGTVLSPTSITITESSENEAVEISYTLKCVVDGSVVSSSGSYSVTQLTVPQPVNINLQSAVGSPDPNSCTMHGLSIETVGFYYGPASVTATATTAVPGSIWEPSGTTRTGAAADICVDDSANGNAGSAVQVFSCNSDLAQYWVLNSTGNLVHNGDCLDISGDSVLIDACSATIATQVWTVNGTAGTPGTIVNQSTGQCLTASSAADATAFTMAECDPSTTGQLWTAPAASA